MSTPNTDLLRRTLAHIEANPERWDQRDWRLVDLDQAHCGTACCFAGWAAQLNGSNWDVPPDSVDQYDEADEALEWVDGGIPVSIAAERALGLSPVQAMNLFLPTNTLDDLRRIVDELCQDAES